MAEEKKTAGARRRRGPTWTWEAADVRALRRHLGLGQRQLAEEMGVRQQTVSEWETGLYSPRGASSRLLNILAERASFKYETGKRQEEKGKGTEEEGSGEGRAG